MDWQLLLTIGTIGIAVGYLTWRGYRILRSTRGGCSGGCGCAKLEMKESPSPPGLIAPDQLTLRR